LTAYFRPDNLGDALAFAARDNVVVGAGFTDLFPATTAQISPGEVLDITAIASLHGLHRADGALRIGAATTWSDLVAHDLPPAFDGLKKAARAVGSIQIQNAATLVGNICNASPAADGIPCLLTLDAQVELTSVAGSRKIDLSEFILGPRKTALRRGEILTAILVPDTAQQGQAGFVKLGARAYLVISITMVAARLAQKGGQIVEAAVSVGACNAHAIRLSALENHLLSMPTASLFGRHFEPDLVIPYLQPITDIRGDAQYRRDVAPILIARLLDQIVAQTGDDHRDGERGGGWGRA